MIAAEIALLENRFARGWQTDNAGKDQGKQGQSTHKVSRHGIANEASEIIDVKEQLRTAGIAKIESAAESPARPQPPVPRREVSNER